MSTPLETKRNTWIVQVTVLSVVLGMLLAAALKTQQTIKIKSGITTTRFPGLVQALQQERHTNEVLRAEIASYQEKLKKYQEALGQGSARTQVLYQDLETAKFLAGLTPATGPGIEVILRDSRKRPPPDAPEDLKQEYIIHDRDIRTLINELLAAGAEAIAVNGQRIIATSAIRCSGPVTKINDVEMSSPFIVQAIGPPDTMESALKMPGGFVEQFMITEDLSDMVQIRKKASITVPAYSGSTRFLYAKPATVEKAKEEQ